MKDFIAYRTFRSSIWTALLFCQQLTVGSDFQKHSTFTRRNKSICILATKFISADKAHMNYVSNARICKTYLTPEGMRLQQEIRRSPGVIGTSRGPRESFLRAGNDREIASLADSYFRKNDRRASRQVVINHMTKRPEKFTRTKTISSPESSCNTVYQN